MYIQYTSTNLGEVMLHKISEMCDLINVIHVKSETLRQAKYSKKETKAEIDYRIADIQAMCRQVANDSQTYVKRSV
jgi:hypothetical protein